MTKSEVANDESITKFTRQWRVRMTKGDGLRRVEGERGGCLASAVPLSTFRACPPKPWRRRNGAQGCRQGRRIDRQNK